VKSNSNKFLPLAIASLLLAIAKPALAANGATHELTAKLAEYGGPILIFLGIATIVMESLALISQGANSTEDVTKGLSISERAIAGKYMIVTGLIVTLDWLILV
jgi:hypothetical protein